MSYLFDNHRNVKYQYEIWDNISIGLLLLSCIIGTAISYAGWNCRKLISATGYTSWCYE